MAGTYLHPGVYIEEVSGGARPIEAVGTSTAAFIGITERGPTDEARFITNFTEFQQIYGGYVRDGVIGTSYLAYAVDQFFQNGGRSCYVVRVEDLAKSASLELFTSKGDRTMTITAISPGSWGNNLRIVIDKGTTSPNDRFNLQVYIKDEMKESYEDLSMVDTDPSYVDRATKRSLYIRTSSTDLPDTPLYLSSSPGPYNLQQVSQIKLAIDSFGPYTIDCAEDAVDVTQVTSLEVCNNINKAFANDINNNVASVQNGLIKIVSPTAKENSIIRFTSPADKDATYDIFGLQEYSWAVKGETETVALALGLNDATAIKNALITASNAADRTISVGIGSDPLVPIEFDQPAQATNEVDVLFGVINKINTKINGIAYTDGKHVILKSDKDISADRSNFNKIFKDDFYSYVTTGIDPNPAIITSTASVNTRAGFIKMKIDTFPFMTVHFKGGETVATVADMINAAFLVASNTKRKVASVIGGKLTITSLENGPHGRIIVANPSSSDATVSVFGTGHESQKFLITAERINVAKVEGGNNNPLVFTNLGQKKMRIAVNDQTVPLVTPATASLTFSQFFVNSFANVTALNYRLLTDGIKVNLVVASSETLPVLYFSVPLKGGPETEADASSDAQATYSALFGGNSLFTSPPAVTTPNYIYEFKAPDNRPALSPDKLMMKGGSERRSDTTLLKNLTEGKDGKSGLRLLNRLSDISLLVIPGWEQMDEALATYFIDMGTNYCDNVRPNEARPLRDLFFITCVPPTRNEPDLAKDYVQNVISKSFGGYTSIYYPWVTVNDPIGTKSPTISVPPSGMIAGLYASIDGRRGVWKAPAGTEAGLAGIVSLADQVSDIKQDLLNPFGVNVIRRMPGAGIVSWGARTLTNNPEWKYIPVRRMAIMMEVSIYEGIQWAVFEPNDAPLWSLLRLNINAFMMNLYRNGAFQGATPDDAFFVKCDGETTTQIDIDLGKVNILVGFAPLKPAEFVIVRISQKAGKKD